MKRRPALIYVNEAGILRPISLIAGLLDLPIVCQIQTLEDAEWVNSNPAFHRHVLAFIFNSDFIASRTRVPDASRSIIYYGYREKRLLKSRAGSPHTPFMVGLLGRIGGSKGHDLVLDAAERLRAVGSIDIHFRFIGEAVTPQEASEWRRIVSQRRLDDRIEFRGYRSDIASELAELDLLAIPSTAEPFGRILCEAAEARCPVVLSDSGGLGELSHRYCIGLRHKPRSVESLVEQLVLAREHYSSVAGEFAQSAETLIRCLDFRMYICQIERLLLEAAHRKRVSLKWYGHSLPVRARA